MVGETGTGYTEHSREGRAVQVGVGCSYGEPSGGQRSGQVGGDGALPHTALAAGYGHHGSYMGKAVREDTLLLDDLLE